MILDHDWVFRYARSFSQRSERMIGVVQNINEEHGVERAIVKRSTGSIKWSNRHVSFLARDDVDALDDDIRPQPRNETGDQSIPRSEIENACILFQSPGNRVCEETSAPRCTGTRTGQVEVFQDRFMRRRLMKKLHMIACAPSAINVTPGISQRSVDP